MLSNYNFNLNPYYDDFDQTKKYYHILFRPGYAVQARELTQLQTQLQNQISKFGDHTFKDGSIVLGGNTYISEIFYIIVQSEDVEDFKNKFILGQTSGARSKVIDVKNIDGNFSKIYFSYTNGLVFQRNEVVQTVEENVLSVTTKDNDDFLNIATSFSVEESIFYVNGHFVYCEPQTIIISEDGPATCRVGLIANETIVGPAQDTSLLDPALGSYNYSAPGADRYSISLDLISFSYNPEFDDVEQNASTDFIELSRYLDGAQITVNRFPIYSEIENTFARRTFDESGNYTVKAFNISVQDHVYANNDLLTLRIEPGKAYIKGYEFETIAPTNLDLPRSRDTIREDEFPIFVNYGNYLLVEDISGPFNFTTNSDLDVYENFANTSIGTCRVKHIEFDSIVSNKYVYRLYIEELNIPNYGVSDIFGFKKSAFESKISSNSYPGVVTFNSNQTISNVLKIPKDYVKTLLEDTESDTSYSSIKNFTATFIPGVASGNATFTNAVSNQAFLGSGTLSQSDTRQNFIVIVSTNDGDGPAAGTLLTYEDGMRIIIDNEQQATVFLPDDLTYDNFTINVTANIFVRSSIQKTKTLTQTTKTVTSQNLTNIISLGVSDCYELVSIIATDSSNNNYDYTSHYEFDTGQTDYLYDHGFISLKEGYNDPVTDNIANIQSVTITFSYFTHSGTSSGYFSVDSYSNLEYDKIPKFKSPTGEVFDLKNCLDFRPRRIDNSTSISGTLYATPSSILTCDFEHYIGRIDKLVLTKERKFALVKGIPSISPAVPVDISDSMNLYILTISPYTANPNEVSYTFVENKRYTMRDIGRIEKRIEKLEYYTALSLLEKQAKDESIPSDVPTIDRFKNGILVDSFAGHSVGDVSNRDYRCAIDYTNRFLRPPFSSDSYTFEFASGSNYNKSGDLITLNYTTETFINQPLASSFVNLNPYNVFSWNGVVTLDPATDNWVDTYSKPDVVVNLNGENDIYTVLVDDVENAATSGVRWTDWQTIINGIPQTTNQLSTSTAISTDISGERILQTSTTTTINDQTTTVTDKLLRTGIEINTGSIQTITRDLGTKVVDTSIIPYIRSKIVNFAAKSLKPKTTLYALFDGIDITRYCFPATQITISGEVNQNAESIQLTSDSNVTGKILLKRKNKIYVRSSNGIFLANDSISWVVSGSTIGTGTATITEVEESTSLTTDNSGDIAGSFWIPNDNILKFKTGERTFKLADSIDAGATTAAAVKYVAQGLAQSTERTLVATRIATVSINPVTETSTTTETNTQKIIVGTTTQTVDITPPPPPPPPQPAVRECSDSLQGARVGKFTYLIEFGSSTGTAGINYNAADIPDRYTIIWDGNEYTTGFVGNKIYDQNLKANGFPNTVGPGSGSLTFEKTKAFPTTAILIVDAPLTGTGWRYSVLCPGDSPSTVFPITTLTNIDLKIGIPSTYVFASTFSGSSFALSCELRVGSPNSTIINPNYFTRVQLSSSTGGTVSPSTVVFRNDQRSKFTLTVTPPNAGQSRNVIVTAVATEFTNTSLTTQTLGPTTKTSTCVVSRLASPVRIDPVAQTFFVDGNVYPNGVFLDSLDLYFKRKSQNLPVTVELRPTVNGYPSSKDIIPFSVVNLLPEEVSISEDASLPTNFKFESPVYLAAGEYSFVAKCNTDEYEIYTAILGNLLLNNPDIRITEQPAIGSMFKSQNSSTWTPIQEEDVMFKINKCVFPTNTFGNAVLNVDFPTKGNVEFDVFFADGETLDFAATEINYFFKTTNLAGVTDVDFTPYQLGSNFNLSTRRVIRTSNNSDLQFRINFNTIDRDITPVIDLNRLSTVLIQNVVDNAALKNENFVFVDYGDGYTANANVSISAPTESGGVQATAIAEFDSNTGKLQIVITESGSGYTGNVTATLSGGTTGNNATVRVRSETDSFGGPAIAKYITRKVTLAPNFESEDLKVYFLANIPTGTSVKVYYKVAPITSVSFQAEPWQPMSLESSGAFSQTGFSEYKYKTPNETALASGDRFKTFAIKIIMLSSNDARVPIIRDLRVVALDE